MSAILYILIAILVLVVAALISLGFLVKHIFELNKILVESHILQEKQRKLLERQVNGLQVKLLRNIK